MSVIWGLPYFFVKLALQELSPFMIAWSRIALGALILLPIAWRRGALQSMRTHMPWICALAVTEFVIPFSAISIGERWLSSSLTAILLATVPLTIALLSRLTGMHERLGGVRLVGLMLGLSGVIALAGLGSLSGPLAWLGASCMLLTTVGYSLGPLIVQRHLSSLDPFGPISLSLAVAAAVLSLPAALSWPRHTPGALTLASIAVLGLVCTATLLGTALLHEYVGVGGLLGLALILVGSWLATRAEVVRREAKGELSL
jgi:drug/metabolite transporter (DMT)-like permease